MKQNKVLVGELRGKRLLRRLRRRWEGTIRIYLREIGWEVVDWIHVAQDKDQWWILVNTVMYCRVP
jgi:hypothetical protein